MRRPREPKARVGEVAYLPVVTVNDTGAFLDWGHARDLLLPYGEQRFRPAVGKRVLVMVREDDRGRPVATQRLDRHLADQATGLAAGDAVDLVIAEATDLGFKAVVDHRFWGLLYRDDVTRPLRRGQRLRGYVKRLREDGRLDLSLLPPGPARLDVVGEAVLKALRESGGYLPLSDASPAAEIKSRLGVSKNAFKQAIGRLYKKRVITIEAGGIRFSPGGDQDSHGAS
ncbi:RNA-binding protein [Halomonas nitroreducens]|uniref:RNA-binding protein n=2 Tax=Halomonas nitroreducens TaxID=447425 RepID=A0A3S0I9E4_9GAMM|nr:S1-like domain-containing RNA-binding protein [Halomonas nitroreducens]RTR05717.1 RNA-binding protein [Halomonas nitroreducens]